MRLPPPPVKTAIESKLASPEWQKWFNLVHATLGGFEGLGAPTALVGLTAQSGSSTFGIRSDGAPALSQAIAPTWTGIHTWHPATDITPTVIRGSSAQTADLTQWKNHSGTVLARVQADGRVWTNDYFRINDGFGVMSKLPPIECLEGKTYFDAPEFFEEDFTGNSGGVFSDPNVASFDGSNSLAIYAYKNMDLDSLTITTNYSVRDDSSATVDGNLNAGGLFISDTYFDPSSAIMIGVSFFTTRFAAGPHFRIGNGASTLYTSGVLDPTIIYDAFVTMGITPGSGSSYDISIRLEVPQAGIDETRNISTVFSGSIAANAIFSGPVSAGTSSKLIIKSLIAVGVGFSNSCDIDGTPTNLVSRDNHDLIIGDNHDWTGIQYIAPATASHIFKIDSDDALTIADDLSITAADLTGSGVRLVTSTALGKLGNSLSIDGNYDFSGTVTFGVYTGQTSIVTLGTITTGVWHGTSIATTYTDAKIKTVTGTANRLSIGGTSTDPIFDISASYIGQASITTLGTIGSGVWQGTSIATAYTDAKIKTVTGTTNRLSIGGTSTDPIFDIDSAYVGQASITTLGTVTTGVWSGTAVGPTKGGTGLTSYATGDILYASAANTLSKLTATSDGYVLTLAAGVPTWAASSSTPANPTASVGLTAVNGVASTYMRSDAAPALSVSISPTWSGTHTFSNTIVGSVNGNSATATALQTPRTINTVSFDGTGNIVVTAAAGTLTGATLNSTVLASSLTSVGTLSTLTVTATITGSITGNAGTATALQTARAINGVNFDGTGAITVTAAAGTLTGTTLNSTVVTSSLTSVGTLTSLALSGAITDTQAIGATSTDGMILTNTTAATVGAQKWSPRLRLTGQGWKTDATAASQTVDWIVENQPVQGTASPSTTLAISSQVNGGGYVSQMTLTSGGTLSIPASIVSGTASAVGNIIIDGPVGNSKALFFNSAGAQRWATQNQSTTNSYQVNAYDSSSAFIDTPISIVNTAAGNITLARPLSGTSATFSTTLAVTTTSQFTGNVGIGANAASATAPLSVAGAASTSAEVIRLQTGEVNGAAGSYMYMLARHRNTAGSNIDGGTIRFTCVDPTNGTRTSKIGFYGSNNEVQTLGMEVGFSGLITMPVTTDSTSITTGTLVVSGGIGVAKRLTLDGSSGKTLRIANIVSNGTVATTFGSFGPTGSGAGSPAGWMRIDANGTDRYIPFW